MNTQTDISRYTVSGPNRKKWHFPWKLVVFALSTQVACHAFGMETWKFFRKNEVVPCPVWLLFIIGVSAMVVCAMFVVKKPYVGLRRHWMLSWLAILGSAWMATSAHEALHHWGWWLLGGSVILIIVLRKPAEEWMDEAPFGNIIIAEAASGDEQEALPPPSLLILTLSHPNAVLPASVPPSGPVTIWAGKDHDISVTVGRVKAEDDVTTLEELKKQGTYFNWQQQLRAACSQVSRNAPEVVFLVSSAVYVEAAGSFFKPYFPNARIECVQTDFENFDTVQNTLMNLIKSKEVDPDHIVIDVTGGYAVTSVAASVFTVLSGIRIQWVPSNTKFDGDILQKLPKPYDIRDLRKRFSIE